MPDTYYEYTANKQPECPSLAGEVQVDVCVVGAGFTGLGVALELARKGYSVVVLEAMKIGFGASGRSGGQVASGYAAGMIEAARIVGAEDAAKLWAFSERAKIILKDRIETGTIDCGFQDGELYAAPKSSHMDWLRTEKDFVETQYGYAHYRWIDQSGIRSLLAGERYVGGLLDLQGGHLHPLNYTLGLARLALATGARIFERSAMLDYTVTDNKVMVRTAQGQVRAETLVLAGNAYLKKRAPSLQRRALVAKSSILATAPLGQERAQALMRTTACVADTNYDLDYFKMSSDYRLIYGGQDLSFGRSSLQDSAIRRNMLKTFPALEDVAIDYMWSGDLSITHKRLPDIGRIGSHVYYAHGYSGQGVSLSAVISEILAEAISGDMARMDVFGRISHTEIPKSQMIRLPVYYSLLLWHRLKDALA